MAKHLMSRTRLASYFGLSVAALKKDLAAAGILEKDGKSPTLAPHLAGAISWRHAPDDPLSRYFLLSRTYVEDNVPQLSKNAEKNRAVNIRHRHSAGDLLIRAGHAFHNAMSAKQKKICSYGNEDLGWLCYESGMATLTPDTPTREIELANRLDAMRERIETAIKRREISSRGEGVALGLESMKAVADWYRQRATGKRRPKKASTTSVAKPIPTPCVEIYPPSVRSTVKPLEANQVALTADEAALLKSGYTLTTAGAVTGSMARAIQAVADYVSSHLPPINAEYDPTTFHWFRISDDGKTLLAAVSDRCLDVRECNYCDCYSIDISPDHVVTLGLPDGEYIYDLERLSRDFDEWLLVNDQGKALPVAA